MHTQEHIRKQSGHIKSDTLENETINFFSSNVSHCSINCIFFLKKYYYMFYDILIDVKNKTKKK